MTENWLLSLIPASLILLLALWVRKQQKSWLAPGAFFSLMWSLYTFLPLLVTMNYYVWHGAVWWIFLCVAAVYFGSILGLRIKSTTHSREILGKNNDPLTPPKVIFPLLPLFIVISSLLGFGSVIIMFLSSGHNFVDLFSLEPHVVVAEQLSLAQQNERYSIDRILRVFIYAGGFFGGALFTQTTLGRKRILAFLPFIPAILFAFLLTTRAWVFYTAICWLGSYLSIRLMLYGQMRLFTRKHLLISSVAIPLLFIFFIAVQMLRKGKIGWGLLPEILHNDLSVSFFGYLGAFSIWIKQAKDVAVSLGVYTFAGVFNLLGLHKREMGLFTEYVEIADGRITNVYTMFRGLIQDFTFPGSLLILFLVGFIAGRAYARVASGNIRFVSILALFYAFTLWTPITSLFNYNTIIVGWGLFAVYLLFIRHGRKELLSQ